MNGIIPTPHIVSPSRGQLAAIAAGYFTEIIDIIAPSEAAAGDLVTVEVRVRNTWIDSFYLTVTGGEGISLAFSPDYSLIAPGEIGSFSASFTMPGEGVRIHVWSWYWTEPEWIPDDTMYIDISLPGVVPEPEFRSFTLAEYQKV